MGDAMNRDQLVELHAAAWDSDPATWLYREWDVADSDAPRIALLFAD